MDPATNPYSPGAGTPPPVLAGRDEILSQASLALLRVKKSLPQKSFIAVGLRGVGKTVIMNQVNSLADNEGYLVAYMEAFDDISLAREISKKLRPILLKLSKGEMATELCKKALRALRSFATALKVSYQGLDISVDIEEGLADTGDISSDLPDLFEIIGQAARDRGTAVALIIDEIQYLSQDDMDALIMAMHRCAQKQLPFVFFGAGLPQLRGKMGNAKSYVERLFDFPQIDALPDGEAEKAIADPAHKLGVSYTPEALSKVISTTQGYPYFIQEWGHAAWVTSVGPVITDGDIANATDVALKRLDDSFFRVRLDRMTPTEKHYIRALAQLGPGSHRSGEVAEVYGDEVTRAAPIRSSLIAKGMIYSPSHGDTAFTVPLFDAFMRREMPDLPPPKRPLQALG
ncbi:ATP-binding protein [Acetobacter fabarum]|uniref:ATP-binding protein n=1 Tax=Acetobacter fabarum TaxID=483199 RepID=UPI0039EA7EE9